MKKFFIIILIIFFNSELSQAMTQKQLLIINQTMNVDQGKVTKQMHTEFWNDVPNKNEIAKFMETTGLMAKITRDSMKYQMELWKSALVSYQNQQIFKSEEYLIARDAMNDFILRISKNIPNEEERKQVVNQMKTSMINSDNLLKSSAARTNMQSVQGPIMEISEQRIKFVILNIEKSFNRIDKLMNPIWVD
jgi:N12 class adenine-specific DNA methylase